LTQGILFSADGGSDSPTAPERRRNSVGMEGLCSRSECLEPVMPQTRGGDPKDYCSDRCRKAAWDERNGRSRPKLSKQTRAEKILARLRQGPATGLELLQAGGGTRYGARLKELRDQGERIVTDMTGEWPTYRLIQ